MLGGFFTADGAANFGWFAYTPLSDGVRSPGLGGDLWIVGIALLGAVRHPHRASTSSPPCSRCGPRA